MFTDIVGYTAMMQHDEGNAMLKVDRYKQVHQEFISKYQGKILKLYGDGSLTLFDSVLNALKCASEIQVALQKDPKVPIRIGIHVGEVIFTEDDIYGDGINIASRIQALGVEGSVLFSQEVIDKIKNQPDLPAKYLGKFKLKNVREEMDVYALASEGLRVPTRSEMIKLGLLDSWSKKQMKRARGFWDLKAVRYSVIVLALVAVTAVIYLQVQYSAKKKKLLTETIPQMKEKVSSIDPLTTDPRVFDLFLTATELDEKVTDNEDLYEILNMTSVKLSLFSTPSGADFYIKPYQRPDTAWYYIGKSPLQNIRFPRGIFRMKIEKEGFNIEETVFRPRGDAAGDSLYFKLLTSQEIPEDMLFIPGRFVGYYYMFPGGTNLRPAKTGDFFVDRNEVTNADFQEFVDKGGYKKPAYWKESFVKGGDTLSWKASMEQFKDKTGWPGPAGWELGEFPDGKEDFPVSGISWYEAAAYADFMEKNLPTIYHFDILGFNAMPEMIKYGNFNGESAVPVQSTKDLLWGGTYNLAGNVSEWIYNANEDNTRRWAVGGNFREPDYQFRFPQSYDSWTRTEFLGLRCIRYVDDTLKSALETSFFGISKGYTEDEVVSDEIFELFKQRWDYEKRPLHPVILEERKEDAYIKQLVQFDVPYEDLPLKLIIWIPLNTKPPYQTVVSWRGVGMRMASEFNFDSLGIWAEEHYLKSGRAVILPIYYSTYGRGLKFGSPMFKFDPHDTYCVIDAQLTCDYIFQNDSLDNDRIAFSGFSWGALRSPFVLAMEKRFKVAIAMLAGLKRWRNDEPWHYMLHYLPRVNTPMLLLGGRYDAEYPFESQKAFIDFLGTPDDQIRWVSYDTGHYLPWSEAINESLAFLDKYFGEVRTIDDPEE
jgi:hypothetical protein